MIKSLFTILATIFITSFSNAQYWQQQVNFTIDVTLNDTAHTLNGFEKIDYSNNSNDTLHFIWFHIWPNAYKNDKTAFSEQMLQNGNTNFYFSSASQKGYINRLNFKVNDVTAKTEDHPQHIDIIKLILPAPLAPHQTIEISTPFQVQLPYNFSRGGHVKQSYQITQWFPKPAVYDAAGWHPMPYLDQGEFYSEFGNYDVHITLPENYVVAATGDLQNEEELNWLKEKAASGKPQATSKREGASNKPQVTKSKQVSTLQEKTIVKLKTLRYLQNNVHDFAWFADKDFLVKYDTVATNSGRIINAWSFYLPSESKFWNNSITYIKHAIHKHGEWLGEYPYNIVATVQGPLPFNGGMEYPTITLISPLKDEASIDDVIFHEVGHNWFQGMLATNERQYPWMDEGMNSYYDSRYETWKQQQRKTTKATRKNFPINRLPENTENTALETLIRENLDQPINTSSEKFTEANYILVAYYKTSQWMKKLEAEMGTAAFNSGMQQYFKQWQYKHPQPGDFKKVMENSSGKNLDNLFAELNTTGSLSPINHKKKIEPAFIFNLTETDKKQYISFLPAIGYNKYDGFMIGTAIHNYQLPLPRFRFFITPLYGTASKDLNGIGRFSYNWYPNNRIHQIEAGVATEKFNSYKYQEDGKNDITLSFTKLAPFIRINFKPKGRPGTYSSFVQFKSYFFNEGALDFTQVITGNDTSIVTSKTSNKRNLQQLQFGVEDKRLLYPYKAIIQLEQAKDFFRTTVTTNYFFNYANKKGGLNLRFFAGAFLYSGDKTTNKQFENDRYHLNLTGANGYEDYTYSNYFVGRNEYNGLASQQIMMRDGGFKIRTDLLSNKVGKTDRWLASMNLTSDIPDKINPLSLLPFKIPLKAFLDIGTFADAWDKKAATGKFLYDAGLQVSLLKETINIYIPLLYSSVFKDYINSTLNEKKFWTKISFSIDIQDFNLQKISKQIPL